MGANTSKMIGGYGVYYGNKIASESRIIRHPVIKDKELVTEPITGIDSLWKLIECSVKKTGDRRFLAKKQNIDRNIAHYSWITYLDVFKSIVNFAKGIEKLGLCKEIDFNDYGLYKLLGIYSNNREEWIIVDFSNHSNGITSVPIYHTLDLNSLEYILNHTCLTTLVMEACNLDKITKLVEEGKLYYLKNVVLLSYETYLDVDMEIVRQLISVLEMHDLKVFTYADIIEAGKANKNCVLKASTNDMIACICYSSDNLVAQNGVILSHKNILATIAAFQQSDLKILDSDLYLSYLPLAHIMERIIFYSCILKGAKIGFYDGSLLEITEDTAKLKPTVFRSTPGFYNKIIKKLNVQIESNFAKNRSSFEMSKNSKIDSVKDYGIDFQDFYDDVILKPIKNILGGKVRILISGSAPLSIKTKNLLTEIFSCPVLDLYGATECGGAATIRSLIDTTVTNGGPITSCEIKLIDAPDLNYFSSRTSYDYSSGEICIRGSNIFKGYFRDKNLSERVIDSDGWLHTGDIGKIDSNLGICVIGKISSIIKLSTGVHVFPEKVENVLLGLNSISQVYVHGKQTETYIVALVYPNNLSNSSFDINLQTEKLLIEMQSYSKANGLKGYEIIEAIKLINEPFSIQNNQLTGLMKTNRKKIEAAYESELNNLYNTK